jgi:CubicO group peptidase (beta-lactamase class C family)
VREPLTEFAEERLFSPLGITDYRWPRDPEGNPLGYGALEVRPRDLVALGRLFLSGGVADGDRVLDADYVERATRAATAGGPPEGAAYGYLWWISDFEGMQMFFAAGYGGQYVVVVPDVDVVAVTTTDVNVFIPSAVSPMKLLTQVVLPNVVAGAP